MSEPKICTCLGTCKGKEGLGEGWYCAMELPVSTPADRAPDAPGPRGGGALIDWEARFCRSTEIMGDLQGKLEYTNRLLDRAQEVAWQAIEELNRYHNREAKPTGRKRRNPAKMLAERLDDEHAFETLKLANRNQLRQTFGLPQKAEVPHA